MQEEETVPTTDTLLADLQHAYQPKVIRLKDIRPEDVVVLVIGVTGSGKSTFVKAATGHDTGIGHGLTSKTNEIHMISIPLGPSRPGNLVIVDTPGFDHSNKRDADVLAEIANWTARLYRRKICLSGVVCLYPVTYPVASSTTKPLRVAREMCGAEALQALTYVTTLWSQGVSSSDAEDRVAKIRELLDTPSTPLEATTTNSAATIIRPFLRTHEERQVLQIQREMVDQGRTLDRTSVALQVFSAVECHWMRLQGSKGAGAESFFHRIEWKKGIQRLKAIFFFS